MRLSLSRVSGGAVQKTNPPNLLVLCEPYEVRCGLRGSHEAGHLRSRGDCRAVPCFRFEIKSKLKELQAVCNGRTVAGRGEGQEGNYTRNVGQACDSPNFQCSCPFVLRSGQENGVLENRRARGSLRGPWQWEMQVLPCPELNCQPLKLPAEWAERRQFRCLEGELAHLSPDTNLKGGMSSFLSKQTGNLLKMPLSFLPMMTGPLNDQVLRALPSQETQGPCSCWCHLCLPESS